MRKNLTILIITLLILGLIYWFFKYDIKHYFISKRVIYWSENVDLKPNDFQAKVDNNSNSNIIWFHSLYLISTSQTNLKNAKVYAIFDKNKSWIKDTLNFNENMKYQKLRFDLYECFSRKYNEEIDKIKDYNDTEFLDLEHLGNKIYSELKDYENKIYETDLPKNEIVDYWRPKIDSILKSYD